ncbi:MAG: glycosyltransferase family 1 protein [Pyrinomonadaceae bacterium]
MSAQIEHQKITNGALPNTIKRNQAKLVSKTQEFSLNANQMKPDLVCWSHLRWDFVYQRPQHLLTRAAADRRVFFMEEPIFDNGSLRLDVRQRDGGVKVVTPYLPEGLRSQIATQAVLKEMLRRFFVNQEIKEYLFWYYTPMALEFTQQFSAVAIVYDCMDELSAFHGAPNSLIEREKELLKAADVVFTGGFSLYEAKRDRHDSVYAFPSSIDRAHFKQARTRTQDPEDQASIAHPRLGFFGVIDERFDVQLIDAVAAARPDWQFVMLGPVVKIHPDTLPRRANIHYLGNKNYKDLPSYIAGWDVALLPFAQNEATRFISPTKTPEYLAAGKPVVSTPIRDVVRPYGDMGLVRIAANPDEFIAAIAESLQTEASGPDWLKRVDSFLAKTSWDETWERMSLLIDEVLDQKRGRPAGLAMLEAPAQSLHAANYTCASI